MFVLCPSLNKTYYSRVTEKVNTFFEIFLFFLIFFILYIFQRILALSLPTKNSKLQVV